MMSAPAAASPNFGFLAARDPHLAEHGARAERYAFDDPAVALVKLRQLGEQLARHAAAALGRYTAPEIPQVDLLRQLREADILDDQVADLFHALRKVGNRAVHEGLGTQRDALHHLRLAWRLAVWFQRAFRDPRFVPSPFVPPPEPSHADPALVRELEALRRALADKDAALGAATASLAASEAAAQAAIQSAYAELELALDLAAETEAQAAAKAAALQAELATLQAQAAAAPKPTLDAALQQAKAATATLALDEADTRLLIDRQLRAAGWQADSTALRHALGARPMKGENLAIAEWPTAQGPADYALFCGLTPIAVIEAKRQAKNVAASIEQAKRYARAFAFAPTDLPATGQPYGDYGVPFLFATNGRPFLQQLLEQSGIWFLDARRPTNHARALHAWHTPDGLTALLAQGDPAAADARLLTEPTDYLGLRDYQLAAIAAVEAAVARGQRDILLAMATGTGKTRTALGLIYRLVKSGRFRRVLFMVDRTALGDQTHGVFKDVKLENLQSFTDIYDVRGLADLTPEPETRLHLATVQGMVKRLLYPSDDAPPIPIDSYDCVIIDECHRGYNLDRELSDTELTFRSEAEYVSKYRRVLDHFDATRVGLTATPALHTTEIFGAPVFQYGYRQAVIDGHLVDHRPPVRIKTALAEDGIHWGIGETVKRYDPTAGQLDLFQTPDEIDIEVDGFNTKVITESFNQVVCAELARQIDPALPGKTLVFCATDAHADMVVRLLKEAFDAQYGAIEDNAVMKITGAADRPLDKIRHFKNERLPNVVVTVDLLTTGIDVPAIVNLVFLRRVKSRILYEQMLGRATRQCDDIGKTFFVIYDAVDLYRDMQSWTDMLPVVTQPNITFTQLATELATVKDDAARALIVDQLRAKMQRKRRRMRPEHAEPFAAAAGRDLDAFMSLLKTGEIAEIAAFLDATPALPAFLDALDTAESRPILVSEHEDTFLGTETGYGDGQQPDDYLEGFKRFILAHQNDIAALVVVTQRPRELTRKALRELALRLDQAGYSITKLTTAWRELTNQDIAASLVGFIRQQALGSPLKPYHERVAAALERVLAAHPWTHPQRTWLKRIAQQIEVEQVVDKEALDQGQFKSEGGFLRLNRVFEGRLEAVLAELHEELWKDAG